MWVQENVPGSPKVLSQKDLYEVVDEIVSLGFRRVALPDIFLKVLEFLGLEEDPQTFEVEGEGPRRAACRIR
jgi:hypothetical protein